MSILTALVGGVVLVAWALDWTRVKSLVPDGVSMKPNTALSFVLLGIAFWFAEGSSVSELRKYAPLRRLVFSSKQQFIPIGCSSLVLLVSALTLFEYLFGLNLGIDELLFLDTGGSADSHPGRMAPNTAIAFLLLSFSILLLVTAGPSRVHLTGVGALSSVAVLLGFMTVCGYASDTAMGAGWGNLTSMALHTGAAIVLLGTGCGYSTWQRAALEWSLSGWLLTVFLLVVGTFLGLSMVSYRSVDQLVKTKDAVRHSKEVRSMLREVYTDLAEMETAVRDYVFIGRSDLLPSRQQWLGRMIQNMHDLRELTVENASHQQRVDALEPLILLSVKLLHQTIAVRRNNGYEAAALRIASGEERKIRKQIQSVLLEMEREEVEQLGWQETQATRITANTFFILPVGTFIGLGLFLAGMFFLNFEVTERRQVEILNHRLANIVQSTDDAIIGKNLNGIINSWNPGAERLFGYSREEAIGRSMMMLIPKDRTREELDILSRIARGEHISHFETRRLRKDGREIDISVTISPVRDGKGNIIGGSKIARDITERKRADEVSRIRARQQEAGARLAQTALHSGLPKLFEEATLLLADTLDVELCKVLELLPDRTGVRLVAGVGWNPGLVGQAVVPVGRDSQAGYTLLSDRPVIVEDLRTEQRFNGPALLTEHGVVSGMSVVISDAHGPWGVLGAHSRCYRRFASHDVHFFQTIAGILGGAIERNATEEEIRRLNIELEHRVRSRTAELKMANEELEAFSYSVSHDLRAPLRAVAGYIQIMKEDYTPRLDAEAMRLMDVIGDETERMHQLINDLLAFSRLGRQTMQNVTVDMNSLVRTVFEELTRVGHDAVPHFELKPLPAARGDPAMLRQVYANLLSNAIKYTRGTSSPHIEAGGWASDNENIYYVKDNGVGFDPQQAHKIFHVFERSHSAAEFEGTGVGLALVERIVRRHSGRVWAEGKLARGATFYFALPA